MPGNNSPENLNNLFSLQGIYGQYNFAGNQINPFTNHLNFANIIPSSVDSLESVAADSESYQDSLEKKNNNKNKGAPASDSGSKFKDTTISPMPDPGDFEPDDEENFDPSKDKNHDQVRRDKSYGKLYRDPKDNRIWYSKERSGDRAHGGEHWKQFKQKGGELRHEADVDLSGKVMNKHKSNVGAVIKLKNTIGIK